MTFVDRLILNRTEESVRIRCPAKVNLFLKVVGKRSDGYHEVENVMQTVTLFDDLEVEKRWSGLRLSCSERELARNPEENLAFKAADLFFKGGYGRGGVNLELKKRVPVAAGLGGGSSDGACCLLALNELFRSGLSVEAMRSLAAELGSDAPFFVEGGTALCTGRGEIVKRLAEAPRFAGILAAPDSGLKTGEMYGSLAPEDFRGPQPDAILRSIEDGDLKGVCSGLFNSFERAALRAAPELGELRRTLQELGSVGTVLCGSGPTLLGIFRRLEEAEAALARLRERQENKTRFLVAITAF